MQYKIEQFDNTNYPGLHSTILTNEGTNYGISKCQKSD